MEFRELVGTLVPVLFVLLLGYIAGRTHSFGVQEASGLSQLALGFALPASLFVGVASLPHGLLASQTKLAIALVAVHLGLFLVVHFVTKQFLGFESARSLIFALTFSLSSTPIFGVSVLSPLLGPTTIGAVALVALAINSVIPVVVVLFQMVLVPVAPSGREEKKQTRGFSYFAKVLKASMSSRLFWAPVLGFAVALSGKQAPVLVSSLLNFIGSATSGIAIFVVGLILAAHKLKLSKTVVIGSLGRISVQTICLAGLAHVSHISGPIYREALVCCSFPSATAVTLVAAKFHSSESEAASILLVTTVLTLVSVPALLYLSR